MQYALFVIAIVAEVIIGRVHLLAARGRVPDRSGAVASLIGIGAGLSFFALCGASRLSIGMSLYRRSSSWA
jgi:hypothetical protein